jgi:serine/threonine-protein kinase
MPSFEIPDGPTSVLLKNDVVKGQVTRTGSANFSVTNKSGQPLAGRLSVQPQADAKAEWFDIMGEKERNFAPAETQKITVNIKTPPAAKVGDYKFRFRAVNVNDPDNDYTDSAVVTFNLASPPPSTPSKFPWWAVAVGAVLFLIVVGVVIWLVIPKGIAVPNVSNTGLAYDKAAEQLGAVGFTAAPKPPATEKTPGTVVGQDPAGGSKADKGSTVTLTIAEATTSTITIPDVVTPGTNSFDRAAGILADRNLNAIRKNVAPAGKAPDTVLGQDPPANAQVPATTKDVTLSVDPGVSVPDVSSQKNLSFQEAFNKLDPVGLSIGTQTCRFDTPHDGKVVDQNPVPGTTVEKGRKVAVVLGSASCFHWRPIDIREIPLVNVFHP